MNKRQELEGAVLNFNAVFVLPMININHKHLPDSFVNSYIDDNYGIILAFDKTDMWSTSFQHFLEHITTNKNYNLLEEGDDEILLYFKIDDYHKINYDLFKNGKYSEFSEEYKKIICVLHGRKTIQENYTVTPYNVIYPQEFKKKQIADRLGVDVSLIKEVLDKPDLAKEQFNPIIQMLQQYNKEDNQYEQTV